ncbi:MAG: RHS repeat-associated core domain-containing protein, partial [Bacteroidota bacterium]
TQYFDSLGRVFMIEDDNGTTPKYRVRNTLDITGRVIAVTDALNRVMTHHVYGLKQQLYTTNIDSGERWMLADVAGKPIYAVNSRGFTFRNTYDALQRPLEIYVTPPAQSEILAEEYVYGTDDAVYNIGRVEFLKDQSGQTHFIEYDFKGNPLETLKTFCEDYNRDIDWSQSPVLQTETFTQFMEYDAMNRPTLLTQPDGSIIEYAYNKAALPEAIAVTHLGQGTPVDYVTNINYNEKGQRTRVYYGNGTRTRYYYDDKTFRLNRLKTTRNSGADVLLDLNYIYDAVGNIVEINDNAAQTFYYDNSVIAPQQQFWYDPLYRLVKATGRELMSLAMPGHSDFVNNIPLPNPGNSAMQNYKEYFTFDALGNITNLDHYTSGQTPTWTREYYYNSNNNYLLSHIQNQTPPDYTYDAHGNMLTMPHLSAMEWDFKDRLIKTTQGTESTYYRYNSSGERSRKITEKQNGTFVERLYLGGYEVYREYASNWDIDFERQTLCINEIKLPEGENEGQNESEEQKKYTFDQNKKIAIIETKTIESGDPISPLEIAIRYQYSNHLGSSCLELDESADIISYEEYHPYGTTSYRSGRTETEVSLKRYKYVGKERDEESGLYYYGARYYADWLCRFISVDPMACKYPEQSPYSYCENSPVIFVDPDGADVKVSLFIRWFRRRLYSAIKLYLQTPEISARYMNYMTAKQQQRYLGIQGGTDGIYANSSDIKFTSLFSFKKGNYGLTYGSAKNNFPGIRTNKGWMSLGEAAFSRDPVNENTELKMRIGVNILKRGQDNSERQIGGMLATALHEDQIHAKPIMDFMEKIWSGALENTSYFDLYSQDDPTNGVLFHEQLGDRTNVNYNEAVEQIRGILDKNDLRKIRSDFDKAIENDIKNNGN